MKTLNYYLQGFGFIDAKDYLTSTFGFIMTKKAITWSSIAGVISSFLQEHLGLPVAVFLAFVMLNIFEFFTGIEAAKKKGERVESRKMGRMFLKVGTYIAIIWMLHEFSENIKLPEDFLGVELKPFSILYWGFLAGIIYQLYKSLMENMEALGWKEAGGALSFTKKKLNGVFDEDDSDSSK